MQKASIVYNPVARNAPSQRRLERAALAMRDEGWEIDLLATQAPGHGRELAAAAARAGAAVVFACGGDGTVNEVVNGLAWSPAAVGLIRGGMGDVFAKEIKVPKRPERALRLLVEGERRRFDLGVATGLATPPAAAAPGNRAIGQSDNRAVGQAGAEAPAAPGAAASVGVPRPAEGERGEVDSGGRAPGGEEELWSAAGQRYFLVMAGVGIDATVVRQVPSRSKRLLGTTAYAFYGVRELLHYQPQRVELRLDGERDWQGDLYWLLLGNTRSYGGVLDITAAAMADDGLLDAYLFAGRGLSWAVTTGMRLGLRRQSSARGVSFVRLRELEVLTPGVSVQVDGEYLGETPMRFTVARGAVEVILPKGGGEKLLSLSAD